jgi:cell shape-determining protein MreC
MGANIVELGFLSGTSSVRPGQEVFTSGDGGLFEAGIPIGTIVDCRTRDFGVSSEARVRLSENLGSLQEVWVMLK